LIRFGDITVCIPSIPPRTEMLQRAIGSVLAQYHPAAGISVSIDHDRLGAAANRNKTFMGVRTEWIAFLDDDDWMRPEHLRTLVETQLETGADVVFPWFDTDPPGCDPFPPAFETRPYNPHEPHMFPITTLVRRELAFKVGGFPPGVPGEEAAGEDWQFWLLLRDAGARFERADGRTWVWSHHGENTSGLPSRW
jgi:glycosyltransferase involved in cell wall biosynthesis